MDAVEEYPHFFEVQLAFFQGPIDLLLHLVKRNELSIETVSLAEVASQYLECLDKMRQFDLEVAGEYLVIAATLLAIKSSVLLDEPIELVEDEDGNLVDPHEELLRRLREAEVYKDGAQALGQRHMYGIDVFSPPSLLSKVKAPPSEIKDHDP
ncbi:MAG: segregation/condensation protein A, partial [Bdellovibrionales bacterium]|nr:segregation/condensation protein A [Bdellovibrionales bacterium]